MFNQSEILQKKNDSRIIQKKNVPNQSIDQKHNPYSPLVSSIIQTASVLGNQFMLQRKANGPLEEEEIQAKASSSEGEEIQTKASSSEEEEIQAKQQGTSLNSTSVDKGLTNTRGGGTPLPKNVQAEMEKGFGGEDFSNVRVHTGSESVQMNKDIGAKAFTNRNDIHFNSGQYNPSTNSGKHLLAHELTHVVQQKSVPNLQTKLEDPSTRNHYEVEADRTADTIISGRCFNSRNISTVSNGPSSIQLKEDESSGKIDHPSLEIWSEKCNLLDEPGGKNIAQLKRYDKFNLISENNGWLEVKNKSLSGWVYRGHTTFATKRFTVTENNGKCFRDINIMLTDLVLPALAKWENVILDYADAYSKAHEIFEKAISDADAQAKFRNDVFAAVLTTVGIGFLGGLGELAASQDLWKNLLHSNIIGGALEDAIQTGVGEAIDINQGNWYKKIESNIEISPNRFLITQQQTMNSVKSALVGHIGKVSRKIHESPDWADRTAVSLAMYKWWNTAKIKNAPPKISFSSLVNKFEKRFWIQWILQHGNVQRYRNWLFFGSGREFFFVEKAIKKRLDYLNIKSEAGIKKWENWFLGSMDGSFSNYQGHDDSEKLWNWALGQK